jgi:hypothetical protein
LRRSRSCMRKLACPPGLPATAAPDPGVPALGGPGGQRSPGRRPAYAGGQVKGTLRVSLRDGSAIAARPLTCPSARRTGSYRGQGGKRGRRCRLRTRLDEFTGTATQSVQAMILHVSGVDLHRNENPRLAAVWRGQPGAVEPRSRGFWFRRRSSGIASKAGRSSWWDGQWP